MATVVAIPKTADDVGALIREARDYAQLLTEDLARMEKGEASGLDLKDAAMQNNDIQHLLAAIRRYYAG